MRQGRKKKTLCLIPKAEESKHLVLEEWGNRKKGKGGWGRESFCSSIPAVASGFSREISVLPGVIIEAAPRLQVNNQLGSSRMGRDKD